MRQQSWRHHVTVYLVGMLGVGVLIPWANLTLTARHIIIIVLFHYVERCRWRAACAVGVSAMCEGAITSIDAVQCVKRVRYDYCDSASHVSR